MERTLRGLERDGSVASLIHPPPLSPQPFPCAEDEDCGPEEFCGARGGGAPLCLGCRRRRKRCLRDAMCCPGMTCSNGEGRARPGWGGLGVPRQADSRPTVPAGLCTPLEPPHGAAELEEPGAEALPRRTPAPAWLPTAKGEEPPLSCLRLPSFLGICPGCPSFPTVPWAPVQAAPFPTVLWDRDVHYVGVPDCPRAAPPSPTGSVRAASLSLLSPVGSVRDVPRPAEHPSPAVPTGQEGDICLRSSDCAAGLCCARHFWSKICKPVLREGQVCTRHRRKGAHGLEIFQRCPCAEGLACRLQREHGPADASRLHTCQRH